LYPGHHCSSQGHCKVYNCRSWTTNRSPAFSAKLRSYWKIDGAIIGRYRSYEKAAELIDGLPESIEQLAKEPEKLKELTGNRRPHGRASAGNREDRRVRAAPEATQEVTQRPFWICCNSVSRTEEKSPSCGPLLKPVRSPTVERIRKRGKPPGLPGFGEKSEQNILKAVEVFKKSRGRFHINTAEAAAAAVGSTH